MYETIIDKAGESKMAEEWKDDVGSALSDFVRVTKLNNGREKNSK